MTEPDKTLEDISQQLKKAIKGRNPDAAKVLSAALQALALADMAYRAKQLLVFLGYDANGTLDQYVYKIAAAIADTAPRDYNPEATFLAESLDKIAEALTKNREQAR